MTCPELALVAGQGLPTSGGHAVEAMSPSRWRSLVALVQANGLEGHLLAAVRDGAFAPPDEALDEVLDSHLRKVCHCLRIESECVRVIDLLGEHGVDARVLKGPAAAHLDYAPEPEVRLFADLDLLICSEDIDDAYRCLSAAGYARHGREPRPGFDRRFSKGAPFTAPSGLEVDVHRTLVMGPFGARVHLDDLWQHSATFVLAGRTLEALDEECRFLHACFHAALGNVPPRWTALRDVAQMMLLGRLDEQRVRALAAAWGAEPVLARAITLTWAMLDIELETALSSWAVTYRPVRRQQWDMSVYIDVTRNSYTAKSVAAAAALPGLRAKSAFLLALVHPAPGFVPGSRDVGGGRRTVEAGRTLLRRARPR